MKKRNLFISFAALGLLFSSLVACGNKEQSEAPKSEESSQPASSQSSKSSSKSSSTSKSSSSSEAPKQSDGTEGAEKYYAWPFGFEGKWDKGATYKWTFDIKEAHQEMTFAFGAQMSSSSHGTRSLYTDHNGASSSDSFESNEANDGTPRITLTVNGAEQFILRTTYSDAGLTADGINYYRVAKFGIKSAGLYEIEMTTNASAGYRLIVGGEARLYYPATEPTEPSGYTVTFAGQHCKVLTYNTKAYNEEIPVEATSFITRDEDGVVTKYCAPTQAGLGKDEVKPQSNFKVECDAGWKLADDSIKISGAAGKEWNELKPQSNSIYRITKIKADIAVTITPVEDEGGEEEPDGFEATFVTENCSVIVYAGKIGVEGTVVDEGPKFYSRDKDDPTQFAKGDKAQINFRVVPNDGYEFDDGMGDAVELAAASVTFITGSFNNLKKNAGTYEYNLTKVRSALTITIKCTLISAGE